MWTLIQHVPVVDSDTLVHRLCHYVCSRDYDPEKPVIMYPFRLRDADGNVYAVGLCSDSSSFDPLDDYGKGAWGCTDIEYWEHGKWVGL